MEQKVRFSLEAARTALDGDPPVLAGLVLAELRQVREVDVHVAADEEIELAVTIVVGEAAAGRPAAALETRALGRIGEGPVAVVHVEAVSRSSIASDTRAALSLH